MIKANFSNQILNKYWQFCGLFLVTILFILLSSCGQNLKIEQPSLFIPEDNLDEKINYVFKLTRYNLQRIITYLENNQKKQVLYPTITTNYLVDNNVKNKSAPNGFYNIAGVQTWEAGYFPGLIWYIYEQEFDPQIKKYWRKKAVYWSNPVRQKTEDQVKDMATNNLFVFRPWYQNSSNNEQNQQLETIFEGAKFLANSLNLESKKGSFAEDIGVYGYFKKADRTDKKEYWHAFMDHTINVEQLLWAADKNPNQEEAKQWKNIALTHIKTLAQTMDKNRNPGKNGSWQRGYFQIDSQAPDYGKLLFNEGKQGWKDSSTWSRGQAWWIYATSVTYQYTKDPEILTIAQNAIDYYLNHLPDRFPDKLRKEGDLIPPWDFDYALEVNPDTEKDTSAASIAVSGMLKLVTSLPPENPLTQKYLTESKQILDQLISPEYLATPNNSMSILLHGCYHHYDSISPSKAYDNGLIWGDYFFIDALTTYRHLNQSKQ